MSWRELLTRYKPETLDNVEDDWEITESQLDDQADWDWVIYFWCRSDSPNARAYRLLESLDLGPVLTGQKAVGGLVFTDGPCPGNDYLGVAVEDEISASLLQKRLSDLNTGIKVKYI